MTRFAIRKIKNGTVKINGKSYSPDEPYRGELDGLWYAFGLYKYASPRDGKMFISLWGTKEQHCSKTEDIPGWGNTPNCIDNVFHWPWWTKVRSTRDDNE